ncbi:hypothetical protein [Streptomyces sp. NBC_00102]|uniref:hypothetical protein n=1 Tax=Streptomyces sp. NBC_00102 TaxID=2975652 RepID=UPI002251FCB2|nr:hypothetical protein [Streptomyces sp. NBC_00102]MCX5398123.1 hypothetical protein [Streptomyces sp. NBC_00102]
MVTTGETSAQPVRPVARQVLSLLAGLVVSVLFGGAPTAIVVGVMLRDVVLFWCGLGGLLVAVLLLEVPREVRSRRQGAQAPRVALARIESRQATNGEFSDVPVRFDLTVVPDDAPAYRVTVHEQVNLVDLADYPEGRILVVTYDAARRERVELDRRPTEEWARRAAGAHLATAPEHTRVKSGDACWGRCSVMLLGLLAGVALVLLTHRDGLDDRYGDGTPAPPAPSATGAAVPGPRTGSSTTVTTVEGSTTSASTLRAGEMRRLANVLVTGMGTETGTRITIEEKVMSAVGSEGPSTGGEFPMLLRAVPYELLPGLVDTARTGLGIDSPESWRIDIAPGSGSPAPVVRVTVSGHGRSAYLLADAVGRITESHPAR